MSASRLVRFGAVLAGLVLTPAFASAAPFMKITFEGDAVGAQPATSTTITNPITVPWAIGGYTATTSDSPPTAANGTLVVGAADEMAQGAIMTTNSANPVLGALWIDTNGFNVASQKVRLSFDVNILAAPSVATTQPKILDAGPGTAGIVLGMNTFTSASAPAFRFAAAPTSAGGGVFAFRSPDNLSLNSFFNYVEGETYHVHMVGDYTTGTVDAWVDGVQMANDLPFGAPTANAGTSEFFFHLNGDITGSTSAALDNIVASAVPEPASLALAGSALVGLLATARRRAARG